MCHICPATLENCFDCNYDYLSAMPKCSVCSTGFYLDASGVCASGACPTTTDAAWSNNTCTPCSMTVDHCEVCVTGFDQNGQERAGCAQCAISYHNDWSLVCHPECMPGQYVDMACKKMHSHTHIKF